MPNDNIFSGLKVVDLASFIAGPSAAVILSDFGADVIKVEPPNGDLWRIANHLPPQPVSEDAYPWHLANRNKRGIALDLKSPSAQQVLEKLVKWADVLIVNTPHPARARLKLEYQDVVRWNPRLIYADITGFGDKGPDANLPGFDITSYWARRRRRLGRWLAVATMPPPSGSIRRSSLPYIVASARGRGRMSRPRFLPKACGPRASRSRQRCARRNSSGCTIARILQMQR